MRMVSFFCVVQNMCQLNGWKYGTDKHTALHELFKEMWMNLSNEGDENFDNEITEEEWVSLQPTTKLTSQFMTSSCSWNCG